MACAVKRSDIGERIFELRGVSDSDRLAIRRPNFTTGRDDPGPTVAQWRILPESFPDAWFRLVTVMLCMTGRIDMFDSYNLIGKIETFSQVSGKDRSIPRKTP